jgi:nicotinate-nucleotide--dimethylbenzimidazole phosphoribosyltransferase
MGIGNTTSATAISAALLDLDIETVTGYGTGIDDLTKKRKVQIIKQALELHRKNLNGPVEILTHLGGFEIGGMVGLVLGAAALGKPIVIDGVIATAAALLAFKINPYVADYLFASHKSVEPAHEYMLKMLGLKPMLDMNLRLGEGSATPLAMNLLESSVRIVNEMATFQSAEVSNKTS